MPYVKPEVRSVFSEALDELRDDIRHGCSAGDLNYLFTEIALAYLQSYGTRYARINDVLGALEGAKLEFYRRLAAPYEDSKIRSNGDVYPPGSVG